MTGRLIAMVGPSGVGKDSVMAEVAAQRPDLHLVRRSITRAPDAGGEVFNPLTPDEFEQAAQDGAFSVHWGAHDLRYGIPAGVLDRVNAGQECLANFSRSALLRANEVFPRLTVLNITAAPEVLAQRLVARGRESAEDIAKRLAQAGKPLPKGLDAVTIANDGPLDQTVAAVLSALYPVRA